MRDESVFKAHTVADILNTVPVLFGFEPEGSLIGISLEGPRRRFGFRMRVDLPRESEQPQVVDLVKHHLLASGADEFIVLCLSDEPSRAQQLVAVLTEEIGPDRVVLSCWATAERWWTPHNPSGSTWTRDPNHPARVAAIASGLVIHSSRRDLAAEFSHACSPAPGPCEGSVVEPDRVTRELRKDIHWAARAVAEMQDYFGATGRLSMRDAAEVSFLLADESVRDRVCGDIPQGGAREQLSWWTAVARMLCGRHRTEPLAVLAFCAWLSGDGVRARAAAEECLMLCPEHRLASLVVAVLDAAVNPSRWSA